MSEVSAAGLRVAGDIGAAVVGGAMNKREGKRAWRRTKVLNQNQIQWRVQDAMRAGVSPLAALGMSPIGQFPVTGSGDLAADAIRGVSESAAGYVAGRGQRKAQNAALAESQARTAESLSSAQRNKAEADYFKTMAFASQSRIMSGGNGRNAFGNASAAQRIYGDLTPSGAPFVQGMSPNPPGPGPGINTPLGRINLNPDYTPHELGEAAIGEAQNVFSVMHLAEQLATPEGLKMLAKGAYERTPIGYLLKNYSMDDIKGFLRMVDDKLSKDIDWSQVQEALKRLERDFW